MVRFYFLRLLKDYLGHAILLGLPVFLIAVLTYINDPTQAQWPEISRFVSIGFILMFQIFGGAYTFEGLQEDFLTAKKDRLNATPVAPIKIVLTQIVFSTVITYLQTLIILVFTIVFFGAEFSNIPLLLLLFLLSAFAAQLLGGVLLFLLKSGNKAQVTITLYAIFAPVLAGFNFQLPQNRITPYLERYSTPLALTRTGIHGLLDQNYTDVVIGFSSMMGFIVILMVLLNKFSKEVIV